jgi:outer membrane immunogenic protein
VKWCTFAGVVLAVSCVGGVARAGDVAAYKAPPPVIGAGMPGNFYAGLSLGARWSDTDWTTTATGSSPQFVSVNPASFDSSTARIGGYAGYMWRIAPTWAVGLEGDLAWGDSSKTIAGIPGACCGGTASVKEGWDGSIRGRFGYLITPAWLLYATGGIAWQGIDVDASCGGKGSFCSSAHNETVSTTQAGWTLGAGLEVMLRRNWLVRLEYRFSDYGHLDHTFFLSPSADRVSMSESLKTQTFLIGFAYKLNGRAPVNSSR